jgi:CRP-like cAMP-binding protein
VILFRFDSGDVISRGGSAADGFYVLQSGRLKSVVEGPNSARTSLAYVEEGNSFGEMSIVDATPRHYRDRLRLLCDNIFSTRHA